MLVPAIFSPPIPHAAAPAAAAEGVTTLIFLWLAFSRDRWWLLAAAAGLVLCSAVNLLRFLHPGLTDYAADSAQIGLWMFVYLALAAGVGERWLAGERRVVFGRFERVT